MIIRISTAAALALTMTSGVALAQDSDAEPALSLGVSTMGVTLEGSFRINDNFGARGLWAGFDVSETEEIDGIEYDADVSLGGVGVLLDYYPFQRGLRLSGGYFMSNSEFSGVATATATNSIDIGGTTIPDGTTATTNITFARESAPMLVIGYDQDLGSRWTLTGEIGAIFTDGFDVSLSESSGTVPTADIEAEINGIQDDLDELDIYPYLSLKASFRF